MRWCKYLLLLAFVVFPAVASANSGVVDVRLSEFLVAPSVTGGVDDPSVSNFRGRATVNAQNPDGWTHALPSDVIVSHTNEGGNAATYAKLWWDLPDVGLPVLEPMAVNVLNSFGDGVIGDRPLAGQWSPIVENFFVVHRMDSTWIPRLLKTRTWIGDRGVERIHAEFVWIYDDASPGWIDLLMYAPAYYPHREGGEQWGHVAQFDVLFQRTGPDVDHSRWLPTRLRTVYGFNHRVSNRLARFELHWEF